MTKAALANVERNVVACTASTGRLGPLIARGDRHALSYAAIDARNRCSIARSEIAKVVGTDTSVDACRRDVDAQERVSIAQLAVLEATSAERRTAVVKALDDAISLQQACGQTIDRLRAGGTRPG